MCGIWATFGTAVDSSKAKGYVAQLNNRGPEGARIVEGNGFQLGFTRLAINGLDEAGMQPMTTENKTMTWVCNGEIYNWTHLASRFGIQSLSGSDCHILGDLFQKLAPQTDASTFFRSLDGVFAMILIDTESSIAYVARDPYGVRPLFTGYQFEEVEGRQTVKRILFASEMKALPPCSYVEAFPPGHYAAYDLKSLQRIGFEAFHTVPWLKNQTLCRSNLNTVCSVLRESLDKAVQKRLMTERPIAALLSGGLDSSLVAALVQRKLTAAGAGPLQTFSIGFKGSEDLRHARLVADFIGSKHTEIVSTPKEFFDAIPQVIRNIESFDTTTVRASVGNWLVSQYIAKNTDCKVVFNGDGSDEVLGGYLYFYKSPSDEEFEYETQRLLKEIHTFDVLRSDRSISSHGLEARTPFLDKQFVSVAMSISTDLRRPRTGVQCEKWILRKAFENDNLLPAEVLWRRKEAFSDGVSGSGSGSGANGASLEKPWFQECQERGKAEVGDDWLAPASRFSYLPPKTAESYYYRYLFSMYYKNYETAVVPHFWMPQWTNATDPSAQTLDIYSA
jgi:asparagine synthase (glutamine-hydrolysing)